MIEVMPSGIVRVVLAWICGYSYFKKWAHLGNRSVSENSVFIASVILKVFYMTKFACIRSGYKLAALCIIEKGQYDFASLYMCRS